MKKYLLTTLIALTLLLAIAGVALANGGPHGGYTPTTDACAGCHRAHTAVAPRLLSQSATYDLCVSCHGSAGAGANTNVEDGFYLSSRDDAAADANVGAANTPDNGTLNGGGFSYISTIATTSSHDPSGTTDAAWGNGVSRGVTAALAAGNLTCSSCHDPHGNSNYRMIKTTLNGVNPTPAQVDEGAAKDYDSEQWGADMSTICAACHSAYHITRAGSGSDNLDDFAGNLDYGGDITSFGHRVDVPWYGDGGTDPAIGMGAVNPETVGLGGYFLPLAETNLPAAGDGTVVCMTCHIPHGTIAAMTGFADPAFDPTGPMGPVAAGDSSLLRLDNRGVCEVCHQK
jgi:predicted CXXCH cytochrome family protein